MNQPNRFHRSFVVFSLAIAFALPSFANDASTTDKWAKHYFDRVAKFKSETVEPGGVVLVGSSHIEGVDAKRWLPRWTIVNRGISSDRIGIGERGILHRLDCSVFDCHPAVIVLQNGANDLGELWRNGTPSVDEIEACYRKVVKNDPQSVTGCADDYRRDETDA